MTNTPPPPPDDGRPPSRIPAAGASGGCCCGGCDAAPGPPFGLPVLAEVPELGGLLEDLVAIDRVMARVLDALLLAQDTSLSESTTGLALERWLAGVAGRTRSDRRMLATAVTACRRLPGVHAAFRDGRLSWAQLRTLALRIERIPTHHDATIDAELCTALHTAGQRPDPDSLLWIVGQVLAAYQPTPADGPSTPAPDEDFLAMQPRLDGTGGTIYGDFGPAGFAAIDNRLAPTAPKGRSRDGFGADADPDQAAATGRALGRARARRLIELCTHHAGGPHGTCDACSDDGHDRDGASRDGEDRGESLQPTAASYVVRLDVETLLRLAPDRAGRLLTTLTGGAMWVDADTARAIADHHGASLRLVLHDQGRVVGVGRRTAKTPGWLSDATLAMHETCTAPGCQVAARLCDTDHALPWAAGGRTDISNLGPVCATDNHAKEPGGWRCHQHPDGRRTWHHEATCLTSTTIPATWDPHNDHDRAPPPDGNGRAPPGHGGQHGTDRADRAPPDHGSAGGDHDRAPPGHRDDGGDTVVGGDDLPF